MKTEVDDWQTGKQQGHNEKNWGVRGEGEKMKAKEKKEKLVKLGKLK